MFKVVDSQIGLGDVLPQVEEEYGGAIVTFSGTVRRLSRGRRIDYIEYEGYREMAEAKLRQIGEEIRQKWGETKTAIVHRLGHLQVGEVAVVIAVSAPHRREAFEACRYAIERLKEILPIWKKEVGEDGSTWVGMGP